MRARGSLRRASPELEDPESTRESESEIERPCPFEETSVFLPRRRKKRHVYSTDYRRRTYDETCVFSLAVERSDAAGRATVNDTGATEQRNAL